MNSYLMGRIRLSAPASLLSLLFLSACGSPGSGSFSLDVASQLDGTATRVDFAHMEILFPVVGKTTYHDDWHDPRDGGKRLHLGNDLLAKKMTPVVAVADGTVSWVRAKKGGECCYLEVEHDQKGVTYSSRYIHLNNDTPGTDDGQAVGIAKGIAKGVHVQAGQLIGWVGDSGNAENTTSHLHFELLDEHGRNVDPYTVLLRAAHLDRVRIGETAVPTKETFHLLSSGEQDDFEFSLFAPKVVF